MFCFSNLNSCAIYAILNNPSCLFLPATDGLIEEEHLTAHDFRSVGEEALENSREDHGTPEASTRPPPVPDSTRTPDTRDEAVSWYLLGLKGNITLVHQRMDQFVLYLR